MTPSHRFTGPAPSSGSLSQRLLALMLAVITLGGCGYSHKELYPEDVRSVAVPIFENRTFYRGVEFDLTEALIKEIELRTPYKVTAQSTADTLLQGTIVQVNQRLLSRRRPGAVPQELEVSLVLDFEWKDMRTGQALRDRKGFEVVGRYRPTQPLGEPFEAGQHAAVANAASGIVGTMQADW